MDRRTIGSRIAAFALAFGIGLATAAWAEPVVPVEDDAAPTDADGFPVWRAGWAGMRNPEEVVAAARELGFTALISHGSEEHTRRWSALVRAEGIESYWWISNTVQSQRDLAAFVQVMSEEDEAALARIQSDQDPRKSGYQFGGEPLPHRRPGAEPYDVLTSALLCFHRPEVMERWRRSITDILEACPDLAGIALDFFGYQNYRHCLCPLSMALFEAYHAEHPHMARAAALDAFSLESLVEAVNALSRHARSVRPGVKTTIHVYPTFLPEPQYGWRLDLDTVEETVAWFFEPYWSAERIETLTRQVTRREGRAYPGSRGVPFFGLYVGRPIADKPPAQLEAELAAIRRAAGLSALSTCSFNEFVASPEMRRVIRDALAENE